MPKEHKTEINYEGGLQKLAEDLGDLRYDVLATFIKALAAKIAKDAANDTIKGRKNLAWCLYTTQHMLSEAWSQISWAWTICKPYMKNEEKI